MIDLAARFIRLDHHIHLNAQFRSDLQWWSLFLPDWNGSGFFQPKTPTIEVVSDAQAPGAAGHSIVHSAFNISGLNPGKVATSLQKKWCLYRICRGNMGSIMVRSENKMQVRQFSSGNSSQYWISPRPSANAHAMLSLLLCCIL